MTVNKSELAYVKNTLALCVGCDWEEKDYTQYYEMIMEFLDFYYCQQIAWKDQTNTTLSLKASLLRLVGTSGLRATDSLILVLKNSNT